MLEMVDLEDLPYFYIRPSFKKRNFFIFLSCINGHLKNWVYLIVFKF